MTHEERWKTKITRIGNSVACRLSRLIHGGTWEEQLNRIAKSAADRFLQSLKSESVGTIVAVELGTGWGDSISLEDAVPLKSLARIFATLEDIHGHARKIGIATIGGHRVVVVSGRIHMYEKNPEALYVLERMLWELGIRRLILTSASGGLRRSVYKGDVVFADGFINNGPSPLKGARFSDYGSVLDPALARRLFVECAAPAKHIGACIYVLGPEFETPDDRTFLDQPGAVSVGMSLVPQAALWAYFAHIAKLKPPKDAFVVAVSCISNGKEDPHGHDSNTATLRSKAAELGLIIADAVKTVATIN